MRPPSIDAAIYLLQQDFTTVGSVPSRCPSAELVRNDANISLLFAFINNLRLVCPTQHEWQIGLTIL
jgi:hypothetical protein